MDLMHAKAEFDAGRLREAVAEPAQHGNGWRLAFHTTSGEILALTDHSGRQRLYGDLDHVTEVGREIGFASVRVEEHF
ncbi:MAG: thymidylate kinase [Gammaproteobacteria bacterium]|jgi:hypothetical protein